MTDRDSTFGFGAYTRARTHEGDGEKPVPMCHLSPATEGLDTGSATLLDIPHPSRARAHEGCRNSRNDAHPPGLILGIDIGAHGAAALLDEAGDLLDLADLPTLDSGPALRPEISAHLFAGLVRRWAPARAWVEWIGPRQGDRPAGAFSFGASKATVETTLAVLGVPFRTITPAVWKRACSIPAGKGHKGLARSLAIDRWPQHAESFARACDHDRAEAALIGWAGLQREGQGR